jgi:hypothetical protein
MTRGIYFMANDRALDHAIALVNSVRAWDATTPMVMIPYTPPYREAARTLTALPGVALYDDTRRLDRLTRTVRRTFGQGFFPRPDNLRKQLCWFGSFDEFLYVDADIVVFERVVEMLDWLDRADFVCYSDQHLGGLEHVFKPSVLGDGVFDRDQLEDVFNAGFWGGRRGVISEERLYTYFEECAGHKAYLDRSRGGSDQPVMNYVVLRHVPRRVNLYRELPGAPGMWAGRPHFREDGHRLFDPEAGSPLRFLHWAGIGIGPGLPYWDVWRHYRFLNPAVTAPLRLARGAAARAPAGRVRRFLERQSDRVREWLDPVKREVTK